MGAAAKKLNCAGVAQAAVAVGLVLTSGACHRDAAPASHPAAAAPTRTAPAVKKGPTAAELTSGMVQAARLGKTAGGGELKFDLGDRPKVGEPLEVNLALVSAVDGGPASIQVTGADAFDVAAGSAAFDAPELANGQVYRHTVRVTPRAEGVQFIGLTASIKHDDVTETQQFSIPVIVNP